MADGATEISEGIAMSETVITDVLPGLRQLHEELLAEGKLERSVDVMFAILELERLSAKPVGVNVGAGWRPIETAPKDGSRILIFNPKSDRHPVCEVAWAYVYEGGPGYWSTPHGISGRGYTILPEAPTHWMPLPEPPSDVGVNVGVSAPSVEPPPDTSKA